MSEDHQEAFFEHLIIGGGLAGSCLALALARAGAKPALIHAKDGGGPDTSASSCVPLALYNPAAAMKARMGWEAIKCHEALDQLIDELGGFCGGTERFVRQNGVLRPCLDKQMQENFQKSLLQNDWPEGWVSWKTPEEIRTEFPGVVHNFGGLWVPVGKTFRMPVLLESLHAMLREKYGIKIIEAEVSELRPVFQEGRTQPRWCVQARKPSPEKNDAGVPESGMDVDAGTAGITLEYRARSVVVASGSALPSLLKAYLPESLKVHRVKGQTLQVPRPVPADFRPSVASKGYIALFGEQAVVGSTYEHHFEEAEALQTTEDARGRLLAKVKRTFTAKEAQHSHLRSGALWAGLRLTTPDRLPLLGALPQHQGLYLAAGFGSKGLMYSSYCTHLLAAHLLSGQELPFEVALKRQLPPAS